MSKSDFFILVADDEEGLRVGLQKTLSLEGYGVVTASSGKEVLEAIERSSISCAFVDLQLPDMRGIDLVSRLREHQIPVVIITAYATVETAVQAMKLGAIDYVQKPFDNQDIVELAERFYLQRRSVGTHVQVSNKNDLIVVSEEMKDILSTIAKVRGSDIPVLLQGESGTGKELMARLVHEQGASSSEPFVAINCAAIPHELMESELFGHDRGAFTGAHTPHTGKFEAAGSGTIFLDEVGDMPLNLQTKLLRALEERSFEPVGSTASRPLKARVIASTNLDLQALVKEKRFRLDLYYRLKGVSLTIPPLRERREDIEPLLRFFLNRYRERYQKPGVEISQEAVRSLRAYPWPGNVRELKNAMESAVLLSDGLRPLMPQDFLLEGAEDDELPPLWEEEKRAILDVLRSSSYNRSVAARELGMSRKTLYNKMKKYRIQ